VGVLFDLVSPRELAFIRHRAYLVLLLAGIASLISMLGTDLQAILVPSRSTSIPVLANLGGSLSPLTAGTHLDGFGAWSPDGQRIAFMRDGAIWMMNADGSEQRLVLQADGVWNTTPSWSPNGKQLAFVQVQTDTGKGRIMVADGQGKGARLVWSAASSVVYLVWTPDGKHLVFSTPTAITRIETVGGTAREVYTAQEGWDLTAGGISVTPDGKRLIFGAGQRVDLGIHYDLYSIPMPQDQEKPAQSSATRLTTNSGIMPSVSPSGTAVVFRNPRRGSGIYLMDMHNQTVRRLLSDGQDEMYFHPTFSPDGKWLSVSRLRLDVGGKDSTSARMVSNLYILRFDAGN